MQSPRIILFFNDELLNNIVIDTNRYVEQKIAKIQLSLWFIWSGWSDGSVLGVKLFLVLVINTGLIPLPDIKFLKMVTVIVTHDIQIQSTHTTTDPSHSFQLHIIQCGTKV